MKRLHASLAIALCASALWEVASAALPQRTFVASNGADTNPCSIAQPCRSFGVAITHTTGGGEVVVLDSAGYGPVTITQAVSLIAPAGVYAGISVPNGQDGVVVTAAPGDRVLLKGLTINNQGGGTGIRIVSGGEIHVESCTVANMALDGIRNEGGTIVHVADTTVRSSGNGMHSLGGNVHVRNSRFVRNLGVGIEVDAGTFDGSGIAIEESGGVGMFVVLNAPGVLTASLSDSVLTGNLYGFVAFGPAGGAVVRAAAKHVTSARNANAGFESNAATVADVVLTVAESASVGNGTYGITAIQNANTVVAYTTSSGNTNADLFQDTGGFMRTSGTNTLSGRGPPDVGGTLTPNPLH